MKYYNIHSTRSIPAIIMAVVLIFTWNNTDAQSYYRYSPPYRSVIAPNPPVHYNPGYSGYSQQRSYQPVISFSLHFDPLISWFSTDSYNSHNDGVVPGFNFGIIHNTYFSPNYSFYSGIEFTKAGGTLVNNEATRFELKNYSSSVYTVGAGESITYRINYLSVPLGLKLQSNQIGYGRFFTDLGFAPEVVIGSRADIPSLNISGGNASPELNLFNLSFHIMAGIEYPMAGNNNFIIGIGYDSNLFDITRDNGDQPTNMVTQKILSFRLGLTF